MDKTSSILFVGAFRLYGTGSGASSTSTIVFSGDPGPGPNPDLAITESWDGTSWTEVADMATGRGYNDGAGAANTNAIYASGYTTTAVANTEEWAFSGLDPSTTCLILLP